MEIYQELLVMTNSIENKFSRYVGGGTTEVSKNLIEWWERFEFREDQSDLIHIVSESNQYDLHKISSIYYNDTRYWWLIAQYNKIIDPLTEIVNGLELKIPSPNRISAMLSTQKGGTPSTKITSKLISPIIS